MRCATVPRMSIQFFGMAVSRGVAIGRAVLIASSRVDVAHYFIAAEHVDAEVDRLRHARDTVAAELSALQRDLPEDAPAELSALLDVHLMLLHDETLAGAAKSWIVDRHYNAEWALSAQLEVLARQFDEMEDDYLRERKADLEQVVERILRHMKGVAHPVGVARISASVGAEAASARAAARAAAPTGRVLLPAVRMGAVGVPPAAPAPAAAVRPRVSMPVLHTYQAPPAANRISTRNVQPSSGMRYWSHKLGAGVSPSPPAGWSSAPESSSTCWSWPTRSASSPCEATRVAATTSVALSPSSLMRVAARSWLAPLP